MGFIRETARYETVVASCLLLIMSTYDNLVGKWKPGETHMNLVAVHTGSCYIECAPGVWAPILYTAKIQHPSWGSTQQVCGGVRNWNKGSIYSLPNSVPFIFFSFSPFFFLFIILFIGGSVWIRRLLKFCPRFLSLLSVLVQKLCSVLTTGTYLCSGEEAAWKEVVILAFFRPLL